MKNNKREKILPFEQPLLGLYPHISNIFAMLENNVYTLPPLMSEMIGMVYDKELDRVDFAISLEILQYMNNYPLTYNHGISRNLIADKWKSYSEFLVDMIDEGYYVHNLLDTYYISAYGETYMREHYTHNSMVYGYDGKNRIFYVADAFEKGVYEPKVATFKEMNDAFVNTYIGDWLDGIRLYKLKEDPFVGLGYNTDYIKEQCEDYLEGKLPVSITNIERRRRIDIPDRFEYGTKIYGEMVDYIKRLDVGEDTWENGDVRMFYAIYDHMNVYVYLIRQLLQRKQIINGDELYKKAVLLRDKAKKLYMNILKYNLTGKSRVKDSIISSLQEFEKEDFEFVKEFSKAIDPEIVKEAYSKEDYARPKVITADSIMAEYDDENNWIRKSVSERTFYTDKKEAKLKCQFFGSAIKLKIATGDKYGQAQILIDGEIKGTVDYSADKNEIVLEGMEKGYHLLELVNITEGKLINFDSLEVMDTEGYDNEGYTNIERLLYKRGTGGGLIEDYGNKGYDIICGKRNIPEYMTLCNYRVEKVVNVLLMHNSADKRGVKKERGCKNNVAAYALSDKKFYLDTVIPGKARNVTLYMVDYDNMTRSMRVIVKNADTGKIYDTCDVEAFVNGATLTYRLKGHVTIEFENVSGPDAVLSAVYFD